MFITVKDEEGNIYTNDMSKNNDKTIIEIHFSTSRTEVIVQDIEINSIGKTVYVYKSIIIPSTNCTPELNIL